jgi:hypothetical protein
MSSIRISTKDLRVLMTPTDGGDILDVKVKEHPLLTPLPLRPTLFNVGLRIGALILLLIHILVLFRKPGSSSKCEFVYPHVTPHGHVSAVNEAMGFSPHESLDA